MKDNEIEVRRIYIQKKIRFPTFELSNSDKEALNDEICRIAALLAYHAGYFGVVKIDIVSMFTLVLADGAKLHCMEISMFYMVLGYGTSSNLLLPTEVDLCKYYPDANLKQMEDMFEIIRIMTA